METEIIVDLLCTVLSSYLVWSSIVAGNLSIALCSFPAWYAQHLSVENWNHLPSSGQQDFMRIIVSEQHPHSVLFLISILTHSVLFLFFVPTRLQVVHAQTLRLIETETTQISQTQETLVSVNTKLP